MVCVYVTVIHRFLYWFKKIYIYFRKPGHIKSVCGFNTESHSCRGDSVKTTMGRCLYIFSQATTVRQGCHVYGNLFWFLCGCVHIENLILFFLKQNLSVSFKFQRIIASLDVTSEFQFLLLAFFHIFSGEKRGPYVVTTFEKIYLKENNNNLLSIRCGQAYRVKRLNNA